MVNFLQVNLLYKANYCEEILFYIWIILLFAIKWRHKHRNEWYVNTLSHPHFQVLGGRGRHQGGNASWVADVAVVALDPVYVTVGLVPLADITALKRLKVREIKHTTML